MPNKLGFWLVKNKFSFAHALKENFSFLPREKEERKAKVFSHLTYGPFLPKQPRNIFVRCMNVQ